MTWKFVTHIFTLLLLHWKAKLTADWLITYFYEVREIESRLRMVSCDSASTLHKELRHENSPNNEPSGFQYAHINTNNNPIRKNQQ